MTHLKLFLTLAIAAFLTFGGAAQAVTTTTYNYGTLLTGYTGAPAAPNFASLVATDNSNGIWNFTLTIDNNLFSTFGNDAFIGSMTFDFFPDPVNKNLTATFLSSNVGGVTSVGLTSGTGNSGLSDVDFGTKFGQGSGNRLSQNDYVSWSVSGLSGSSYTNSYVHVQGGPNGGSAKYLAVSVVPEPETYAMMLAGLGLLGFTARRRKNS